ncbi:hypothetical protein CEXT_94411 [Caerostris extrusa]|uniref:Uncharacterized protein n=1 Tax=Caerostris extrusa TaxID=172846 RepID=A0AAV4XZR9_CAEEX|nr:hypothetical protein CEXT_94411 [Caerostris extrusa]
MLQFRIYTEWLHLFKSGLAIQCQPRVTVKREAVCPEAKIDRSRATGAGFSRICGDRLLLHSDCLHQFQLQFSFRSVGTTIGALSKRFIVFLTSRLSV